MNQTPPPGWAYPAGQPKVASPKAHFYQVTKEYSTALCGKLQYRGQQVHTTLRTTRERCPECNRRGKDLGFFR